MPKKTAPTRAKKKPATATAKAKTATKVAKTKTVVAPTTIEQIAKSAEPRRLSMPKRIWYKPLTWRNGPPAPDYKPLPKARILFVQTLQQLWTYKRLFCGIVIVYGILNLVLIRGIAGSSDLSTIKGAIDSVTSGFNGKVVSTLGSFTYLLVTSGSSNTQDTGSYQYLLLLICSLAFIWAFRQTLAKRTVRIRDSFYQGMYPFIPFVLVLLLLGLQLIPMALGASFYGYMVSNGIAIYAWEKLFCIAVFAGSAYWSLRMITGGIFALYIVTLPNMTPIAAMRSATKLVYGRRLMLWRKLIFLPIVMLLIAIVVEVPFILVLTVVAPWVFFIVSMIALPVAHGYIYKLYREML